MAVTFVLCELVKLWESSVTVVVLVKLTFSLA
jgi:hypothetical protein